MARLHQVQQRPRRESKEIELKTELQMLRAQNQKLRRENSRLRRDNEKLLARELSFDDFEDVQEPAKSEAPLAKPDLCPLECNVALRRIVTPVKTIVVCPTCKWRKTE